MKKYTLILLFLAFIFNSNPGFAKSAKHHKKSSPCNSTAAVAVHHHKRHGKAIAKHHVMRKHPMMPTQETINIDDRSATAIISIKDGNVYVNDSLVTTVKNPKNEDHRLIINYITPAPAVSETEHIKINSYTGEKAEPMLGIYAGTYYDEGVVIRDLLPCGPAYKAGLYFGDIITKINDKDINTADDLRDAIKNLNPGDNVSVTVKDFDGTETKQIELAKKQDVESCGCMSPYAPSWGW